MAQRKACGRRAFRELVDCMLDEETNMQKIREGLQEQLDLKPLDFVKQIVMPMLPKEVELEVEDKTAEAQAQRVIEAIQAIQQSIGQPPTAPPTEGTPKQ